MQFSLPSYCETMAFHVRIRKYIFTFTYPVKLNRHKSTRGAAAGVKHQIVADIFGWIHILDLNKYISG